MLRALAILGVVSSHTYHWFTERHPELSSQHSLLHAAIAPGGFFGVELFFVLSGFLIGHIIVNLYKRGMNWPKIQRFYLRRWFRTLPLYYLMVIVRSITKPVGFSWTSLVFLQNFFPHDLAWFPVSWSLAVEEWFYLMIPLLCWGISGLLRNQRLGYALLALICLIIIIRTWYVGEISVSFDAGIRKMVPLRFDSLLIGVLAALLKQNWAPLYQQLGQPVVALLSGGSLLLFYIIWGAQPTGWNITMQTALVPLISLSVAGLLPWLDQSRWLNQTLPNGAWPGRLWVMAMSHISLVSYSLYLGHGLVMNRLKEWPGNPWLTGANTLGVWAAMLLVATGLFYFIEQPFMKLRDKLIQ